MANQKISQMTQYPGALAGSAIFPTVAGGTNYQVTASNIAAYTLSSITTLNATTVCAVGNVYAGNAAIVGNVSASYFTGNGAFLTGLPAQYSNANVAAYLPTYTGNIGANVVLANSASTAGNVIAGNVNTSGAASVGGNITTLGILTNNYYYANGVPVTFGGGSTYANANVAAYLPTYGGNIAANVVQANIVTVTYTATAGNLVSNGYVSVIGNIVALGNIVAGNIGNATTVHYGNGSQLTGVAAASVGTLTNLTVTGNVIGGHFAGEGGNLSNVQGSNVSGSVSSAAFAASVGTLASLSVTGTATAGNFVGEGGNISNIQGSNVSGAVSTAATATAAVTAGTVTNSVQGNITSLGLLSSLSVRGTIIVGSGTGTTSIVNGGTSATGNIGSAASPFNTVYAQATTALYADLAENYLADAAYSPGTVVSFGGDLEVTQSTQDLDVAVAGVVSTNPAYTMNSGLEGRNVVAVALTGRVPCRVTGPVAKGAMMVSAGDGTARAESNPVIGSVLGKALESADGSQSTIEIVVGRL